VCVCVCVVRDNPATAAASETALNFQSRSARRRSRGSGVSGGLPIYSPFTADDSNSVTAKYTGDLPEATP